MIEIGNILTLDNNQDYLMLEVIEKNGTTYAYAVRVLEDETPTDEFLIFEGIKNEEGEFLKVVQDEKLYVELIAEFKEIVENKISELPIDINSIFNTEEA